MTEAQRNFAAILELLEEHDVPVIKTEHEKDYGRTGPVSFTLTVQVPAHAKTELREGGEHRLGGAEPESVPEDAPRDSNDDPTEL